MSIRKKRAGRKIKSCAEKDCTGKVVRKCETHGWICESCLHDYHSKCKITGNPDFENIQTSIDSNLSLLGDQLYLIEKLKFSYDKDKLMQDLQDFKDKHLNLKNEFDNLAEEEDLDTLIKIELDIRAFRAEVENSDMYKITTGKLGQVRARETLQHCEDEDIF
jgi:hypothetical protein